MERHRVAEHTEKIQLHVAYKRLILALNAYTDTKEKLGKNILCKWKTEESRVAIIISDK